jgi:hypothetical protein
MCLFNAPRPKVASPPLRGDESLFKRYSMILLRIFPALVSPASRHVGTPTRLVARETIIRKSRIIILINNIQTSSKGGGHICQAARQSRSNNARERITILFLQNVKRLLFSTYSRQTRRGKRSVLIVHEHSLVRSLTQKMPYKTA